MYVKLNCAHCSKSLKIREDLAGKKCRCPYCKHAFVVPAPAEDDVFSGLPDVSPDDPLAAGLDTTVSAGAGGRATPSPANRMHSSQSSRVKPALHAGRTRMAMPRPSAAHASSQSTDGTDVPLVISGVVGLAGAVTLFGSLYPLWLSDLRIGNLFWNSVEINFFTTWLMFWSFAILFFKWRQLARQKSAMLMDLLPSEISQEITLSSLDEFADHIHHNLPFEARQSFLVNRVLRGIEHFRVRKSAADTVTMMESQSAIDASNVAGSYAIIKVFIWAMPILGFIGTVMGVGGAVSGLSATLDNAADVSAVTNSMRGVFRDLGTAFDTTLLALIMSMLVKIPQSALQKSETGLVIVADEYCNENLLRRLNDGREGGAERGAGSGFRGDAKAVREAVDAAMAMHRAELENWLHKLDGIGSTLTARVAEGWADINSRMKDQQEQQLTGLRQQYVEHTTLLQRHLQEMETIGSKLTMQVASGWSDINSRMKEQQEQQLAGFKLQYAEHTAALQRQLQEMNGFAVSIQQALTDLSGQAAAMQGDVSRSVSGSTEALRTHFAGLERGLTGLSSVLESLGEKQVLVQQVLPERRGWFAWRKRNGR